MVLFINSLVPFGVGLFCTGGKYVWILYLLPLMRGFPDLLDVTSIANAKG